MPYINNPIEVIPGIQPETDATPQSTSHFTDGDKIRFVDFFSEKIGGWERIIPNDNPTIQGCARSLYSFLLSNTINYLVGTNTGLYHLKGSDLSNMTPVKTTTTPLNNVLSTFYGTLVNDPIATIASSGIVTITDAAHKFINGDIVTFSGSTDVNGILAAQINTSHVVGNATTNTYQITTAGAATSSGSGGGAAIVRASRIVTVLQANTFLDGDNVVISNLLVPVGGIPSGDINGLRQIRKATSSDYDIEADSTALSSVTNVGGDIDVAEQIDPGSCDPVVGQGYGLGIYGDGLYGVAKTAAITTFPIIWSFDRFGNLVVFTRDNQGFLYSWNGDALILPEIVNNAPTQIDYVFVSNEIVVTLGASGIENRIQWSDQGNLTVWTGTAENSAGQDDIEGASKFISHAQLRGFNLLFTREEVYSFRFIGKPFVWETNRIDPARGLIARNARIVVNGICYWMGRDNFYMYRGANVEIIPSNTVSQSTAKKFVFDNINPVQESKIFCWYNEKFNEIWWHYPDGESLEPNRVITFNVRTNVWSIMSLDRSAGEYPATLGTSPILAKSDRTSPDNSFSLIYSHETGKNDDGSPMQFTLKTPFFYSGTEPAVLRSVYFDSIRNGDLTLKLNTKFYPKGPITTTTYTLLDTTEKISFRRRGRYWQYEIIGEALDQDWCSGDWVQEFKPSGKR
jgi:hypothetical protein